MPRKKGLGRDMEKTLENMDGLLEGLECFSKKCSIALKKNIGSAIEDRDKIIKAIDEASEEAHKLHSKIFNLKSQVSEVKALKSSRFARRVVANFLEASV